MPKKPMTAQLESTDEVSTVAISPTPIEKLQGEIESYSLEIQKLRQQLSQLKPSPPPYPDLDPASYAQALISGAEELDYLQARARSTTLAINALERIVEGKQSEINDLIAQQQKDAAVERCSAAQQRLHNIAAQIESIGGDLLSKFLEVKQIYEETDQDFKLVNPPQGVNYQQKYLINFQLVAMPKLIGRPDGTFSIDVNLVNLFSQELQAIRQQHAAASIEAERHMQAQAEQQRRQVEVLRLHEKLKNLSVARDAKHQEITELETAKVRQAGKLVNFSRVDAGINTRRIEAEEIAKQMSEIQSDIERG